MAEFASVVAVVRQSVSLNHVRRRIELFDEASTQIGRVGHPDHDVAMAKLRNYLSAGGFVEFLGSRLLFEGKTIAWLQGGLGNQLFQWNAAIHVAETTDSELLLSGASYRRDRLRSFAAASLLPSHRRTSRLQDFVIGPPYERTGRLRQSAFFLRIPVASTLELACLNPSLMVGFFQEDACLNLSTSHLVNVLKNRRNDVLASELGRRVRGRPAIHVRRGDYAIAKGALDSFGSIRPEYYRESFDSLNRDFKDAVAFTDDPNYVMKTFGILREDIIGPDDTRTDLDSMLLMSLANGLVIPNSTFSWWAAEISDDQDLIRAPENWFINDRERRSLARDSWGRIAN